MVKVVLWIVLLIIILANLGVNVSALVAGLGIMGFVVKKGKRFTRPSRGNTGAGTTVVGIRGNPDAD